jgi:hypothetical protein
MVPRDNSFLNFLSYFLDLALKIRRIPLICELEHDALVLPILYRNWQHKEI